jgi:hypothetical protein
MMTKCQKCGREATSEERELGWPTRNLEGRLVCPSCYGDEALCAGCGALLRADDYSHLCPKCASSEPPATEGDDEVAMKKMVAALLGAWIDLDVANCMLHYEGCTCDNCTAFRVMMIRHARRLGIPVEA